MNILHTDSDAFPLSPSQELVWFHEQMLPGSRAYNFNAVLELRGKLDEEALFDSLRQLMRRHDSLRVELAGSGQGSRPLQRIRAHCEPSYRVVDLTGAVDAETAFQAVLYDEIRTPIDSSKAPLVRWFLVRIAPDLSRLIHVEHHLVHDGHSFMIILGDLFNFYRTRIQSASVPIPEAGSYADYLRVAVPHNEARLGGKLDFWQRELSGADFDLRLPGLERPGAARTFTGGQVRQRIDADLADALRELSRRQGHTVFSTMLGLFGELLRRHSGQDSVVVGSAVGNRQPGTEKTAGMFVNTIPLWLRLNPDASATAAIDEVTETLIRVLPYQDVPIQGLTRSLGLWSAGADNPLFSVMFSAHDAPLPDFEVPGLEVRLHELVNTGTTRFDLDIVILPDGQRALGPRRGGAGMLLIWDYSDGIFTASAVELLADRLVSLARAYISEPEAPLRSLGRTPVGPMARSAATAESGAADLAAVLAAIPARDPGSLALLSGTTRLQYRDLDHQVGKLASQLQDAGVRPGQAVAVILPRGADSVVALLACLRISAVYCPLSAHDPAERLAGMIADLRPVLVLSSTETASQLPRLASPAGVIDRGALPRAVPGTHLDDAAYVIHTSGSTGKARPVVVSRAALANHVLAVSSVYEFTAADRALLFAQPSFDVSLEEVLPPLVHGAALVTMTRMIPTGAELTAILAMHHVTVANLPTSYLIAFGEDLREALGSGRWQPRLLIIGGERIRAAALRGIADRAETALNAYGVTEAAITSTIYPIGPGDLTEDADIPLGAELPGVRVHILDAALQPLPDGAVGEIAIAGWGLASGYLYDEAATADRFPAISALGGERLYLTGDIGYRDMSGRLWFSGRRDNQVKLRGYRIELEEIESAASAELGGRPCAVVLAAADSASPRLVGFVADNAEPDRDALYAALARRLPSSMQPSEWIRLDSLPTLAGGKPDRRMLASLTPGQPPTARSMTEPGQGEESEILELLSAGWRHVLGHSGFTSTSNFFQVGGHSLLAAQLAAWLEERLGTRPRLRLLFQHPVLDDLARTLASEAHK